MHACKSCGRDPMLNSEQACEYLGVSDRYLKLLRYERRISFIKLADGRRGEVRYALSDLEAFKRTHRIPARAS